MNKPYKNSRAPTPGPTRIFEECCDALGLLIKQLASDRKAGAILLGVLYYLTDERDYLEQARAKLYDFIINKRGILAADTGAVHSLNNKALSFAGSQVHSDSLPHITEYARQTIAHNSITVGSEPLELKGWDGKSLATVCSGGQSPIQDKTWWKSWGLTEPKPGDRPFQEGQIIAYETSPRFDYAAGDATHSYPPTRVKSITRQFVYLRPDTFVIFDRVAAAEANLEVRWLLHSLYEPQFDGQKTLDPSWPPERQRVVSPDGRSTMPNPQPGCRFLHRGGSLLTLDDKGPGMSGRLFVKVLLPAQDARVVRTVGGPWHEFEVEGINYGRPG